MQPTSFPGSFVFPQEGVVEERGSGRRKRVFLRPLSLVGRRKTLETKNVSEKFPKNEMHKLAPQKDKNKTNKYSFCIDRDERPSHRILDLQWHTAHLYGGHNLPPENNEPATMLVDQDIPRGI